MSQDPHDAEYPSRAEFAVLVNEVKWVKYGVALSVASSSFGAAVNFGVPVVPSAVVGVVGGVIGVFR